MCNILSYAFTCTHTLAVPRSRCHGTHHKQTAAGPKAACTSTPSLTLYLPMPCSPCQLHAFEDTWTQKLSRAHTFLDGLRRQNWPGEAQIDRLVAELEEEHARAMWGANRTFSRKWKGRAGRVKCGVFDQTVSGLRVEVVAEDVVVKEEEKEWWDLQDGDYDGDYVASEDPLHPVCTEYVDLYVGGEVSEGEADGEDVGGGVLFEETAWDWGGDEGGGTRGHTDMAQPGPDVASAEPDSGGRPNVVGELSPTDGECENGDQDGASYVVELFWATVNLDNVSSSRTSVEHPDLNRLSFQVDNITLQDRIE